MTATRLIRHIFLFNIIACFGIKPASAFVGSPGLLASGKITDTVFCKSDPGQSYALYIPEKGNKTPLPVIYFFDPHADGSLPLRKYKTLADAYGFILIGSNNSKNGNDGSATGKIWDHLFDDTKNRLKIDPRRIYTCGFSGGAKVAGFVAIMHPEVTGVIANGAGLPDGTPAGDFNFSFTAIAGEGDMNMTDLVAVNRDLDNSRTRHRIIIFDGKHEWAPQSTMNLAFAGLQFDAMRKGFLPKDQPFIKSYIEKSKNRIASFYKTTQLTKAAQECKLSINLLDRLSEGSKETAWFKAQAATLAKNTTYQKQKQAQEELLVREQNTKAGYAQHFQEEDPHYWITTIVDLRTKAGAKTAESGMDQRLLAYLSLVFYSFSNRLINSNENSGARHFVELYKIADPDNSEAWYFSAILNARSGQSQAAEKDLLKATEHGFKDRNRMRHQPEFQNGSNKINFSRIESNMHTQR